MSIHRVPGGFKVRWRQGNRQRARTFDRFRDADAFNTEVRRRRQLGGLVQLDAGALSVGEMVEEWWRLHALPNLRENTRRTYAAVWDKHGLPRLGGYELRELSPAVVQTFRAELARIGVGDPTILKVLTLLQSVMRLAVVQGRVQANPVSPVKKPSQRRAREVRPLAPETVEAIRWRLDRRDAALVSLLAYAGPRPAEALALAWRGVREHTLLLEETKTGHSRTVVLLAPLAQDLAEWRLASGRPADDSPVFPNWRGGFWRDSDWRNWRRRTYQPAAEALGAPKRPYDLRHSFVSLLIHEGLSVVEVARQAGHSVHTCLSTYAHVIDEFDPGERISAEAAIRRAREQLREAI